MLLRFGGFVLLHLALLGAYAVAAFGFGRFALRRLVPGSTEASFGLRVIFGLGALATIFFAAGTLGLLRSPLVVGALAAGWALARPRFGTPSGFAASAAAAVRSVPAAVLSGLGVVLLAAIVSAALYPPTDADSTMYHLPAASEFATSHALPALADLRYPVFPQLHELLAAAALLVGDDLLAQLLNVLWALLTAGVLWGWGAGAGDRRLGAASAALWFGSPVVLFLARTTHVELAAAAFALAAVTSADRARDSGDVRWWTLAGAFAGWAAATKYTGLYFVAALGVLALVRGPAGARFRSVAAFAVGALAAALPWYARSWLLSGNPVWPFLGSVFGYSYWTAGDVKSAVWTLRHEGGPQTWRALLALPWKVLRQLPSGPGRIAPVLCGLLPLGMIGAIRHRRWRPIIALVVGYGVFWFWTTQQLRFLVPVLPAAALLTVAGVLDTFDRLVPDNARAMVAGLVVALAVAAVAPRLVDEARVLKRAGPPPYDAASREAYLERTLPSYFVYRSLNAAHGSAYTIYAFYDEPMKYYCRGRHLGEWFGHGRYADVKLSSGEAIYASLRTLGADYLLLNDIIIRTRLPDDASFRAHFEPVIERPQLRVYRLR